RSRRSPSSTRCSTPRPATRRSRPRRCACRAARRPAPSASLCPKAGSTTATIRHRPASRPRTRSPVAEERDAWLSAMPPDDPLPRLREWLDAARAGGVQPNPDAAALATAGADGRPAVRTVLCRAADWERGWLGLYTHLASAKARALDATGFAALLFHWDALGRQA